MKIRRHFTVEGQDAYDGIAFRKATSEIRNPDGSVVFRNDRVEAPEDWSQVAIDILAQKYFRKAGVADAADLKPVPEENIPAWLARRAPGKDAATGGETSARQVFDRLAGTWTYWGWKGGYFAGEADARAYYDEMRFMLARQMAAPNSPQWFNTGLHWAYGIDGPGQGHHYVDHETGALTEASSAYEHPQPHACFIQSISDDLVNDGGIMDLWVREARLFKYGSGTGTNFSNLRGANEPLSGGGKSSGLMSFLKIGDRAAGAIKSGGTTRRAAKMVIVDVDHPDILEFVNWKVKEEQKVAALVAGSRLARKHLNEIMRACREFDGAEPFDPRANPSLKKAIRAARKAMLPQNYIQRVIQFAEQGFEEIEFATYDTDWDSEAYLTVSGQNSNNSVRVTNEFLEAAMANGEWTLFKRTTGEEHGTVNAGELWKQIAEAAWQSADPGVQFDSTINEWHTCPAGGRINASNPCSEYMFLDDTACNLASLNLLAFRRPDGAFDVAGFEHAVRLWTLTLEISVLMAQFPSRRIAELSYRYRTLGLGFANVGGYLMASGLPYDSDAGRAFCGAVSALMTGAAYETSADMAAELGPFPGHADNAGAMLRVMRNHRRAAHGEAEGYEGLTVLPVPLDRAACPDGALLDSARAAWDRAIEKGEAAGYRNAQATVIAPTGTIGLVMDCDTTGIEPDLGLVKSKRLVGGGTMEMVNTTVPRALRRLGYTDEQIEGVTDHIAEHHSAARAPLDPEHREVFACSLGDDAISTSGHIGMMAAVQPFLSGAISKTVNMPADASVDDVERLFIDSWRLGLKSVAIYRDCSKVSQPLTVGTAGGSSGSVGGSSGSAGSDRASPQGVAGSTVGPGGNGTDGSARPGAGTGVQAEAGGLAEPVRRRLPKSRRSCTFEFRVADCKGFVTVGEYPDGRPGEIFVKVSKQGSTLAGIMDAFAISVSHGLQYGVPLSAFVDAFVGVRFEPAGITDDPDIRIATSLMDYLFRKLAVMYLTQQERAALGVYTTGERTQPTLPGVEEQVAETAQGHDLPPDPPSVPPPGQLIGQLDFSAAAAPPEPAASARLEAERTGRGSPASRGALSEAAARAARERSEQEREFMGTLDAPFCMTCGVPMRRAGSCYVCADCGATSGCS